MTTAKQARNFREQLLDKLDDILRNEDFSWVIEWVSYNCEPDDIFTLEELEHWAEDHGYEKKE